MNTTILILVIPILVAIIATSIWVLHSKRFSGETSSLVAALAQDSNGQRYEVIEIEGSRYLRGPFRTIIPYIKPGKE